MLKGHVFAKQIFGNPIFALFINTFLNGKNGVSNNYKNGMEITHNGNMLTVQSGVVCIQGRFLEEDSSTNISAGNDTAFCKLIIEIDLDKQNTESDFTQGAYKIVKSTNGYPNLTQTDIVKNNAGIYQYELARFKNTINGITDFQDMRTFLDFNSIYTAIQKEYRTILSNLKQELESVQDGSAYMLKKEADEVKTKVLKGEYDGDSVVVVIRRNGHIVTVNIELTLKAGSLTNYVGFHLDEFPDWAIPKKTYDLDHAKVIATAYSQLGDEGIINRPQIWFSSSTKRCRIMGAAKNLNVSSSLTDYCTLVYMIDDELPGDEYQLGDVNGDGLITEEDLELLQNYLEGNIGLSDKQKELADVNKDGELDSGDLFKFRQYLLGQITSFE